MRHTHDTPTLTYVSLKSTPSCTTPPLSGEKLYTHTHTHGHLLYYHSHMLTLIKVTGEAASAPIIWLITGVLFYKTVLRVLNPDKFEIDADAHIHIHTHSQIHH